VTPGVVIATIPVGEGPTLLALSPGGERLYAAANSKLSVIDCGTNAVVATMASEPDPAGVALWPDGARAFLTSLFATHLAVFDTTRNAVLPPISLFIDRFVGGFGSIAVAPDGRTVYIANRVNQAMGIVDLMKGSTDVQMMDMQPIDIAVALNGRTAYVVGCKDFCTSGTIELFDTAARRFSTSISVGSRPYRIKLSPDGSRAYTTNLGDPSVSVVDLATNQTIATVPVPVEPTGLAVSRDGALSFVTSHPTGSITVIRNAANTAQPAVQVAGDARDVVVAPDGRRLYVSTSDSVVVVDAQALVGG
jgi:YVTN family beta-propeller protein